MPALAQPARRLGILDTQKDHDVIGGRVGRDEIEFAIAVEVAHGDGVGMRPYVECLGGAKLAVAGPQQNAYCVVEVIGDRDIDLAVAVEIAGRDSQRGKELAATDSSASGVRVARPGACHGNPTISWSV